MLELCVGRQSSRVSRLTAQRGRAPVHRNALVAAALGVGRHAGAETLTVAAPAAGAGVGQTVHVEPGDVHLETGTTSTPRDFHLQHRMLSYFILFLSLKQLTLTQSHSDTVQTDCPAVL